MPNLFLRALAERADAETIRRTLSEAVLPHSSTTLSSGSEPPPRERGLDLLRVKESRPTARSIEDGLFTLLLELGDPLCGPMLLDNHS
jgi:hypothetical protein